MAEHPDVLADHKIQDYIDGRLGERDQATVAAYLMAHPEISSEVEALRRQNEALKGLGQKILEEPVPERLRAVLQPAKVVSLERRRPRPSGFLEAAAAIVLFCLGSALGWFANGTLHPLPGKDALILSDAASAYAFYHGQQNFPIEFPPERNAELASWLSKAFPHEIQPPDLESLGYRYLGGRLLPGGASQIGAFMFGNAQDERVVVFFWLSETPPKKVISVSRQDEIESRFWFGDGFGFAVTGDESNQEIDAVAKAVFAFYEDKLGTE